MGEWHRVDDMLLLWRSMAFTHVTKSMG